MLGLFLAVIACLYLVASLADARRARRAARRAAVHLAAVAPQLAAVLLAFALLAPALQGGAPTALLTRLHGPLAVLAAAGLGALGTGGPVVAYPIAGALYRHGAGLPPAVTAAFLTAWTSVSFAGLPLEAAVLGRRFALARNAVALVLACLAGFLVGALV